MAKQLQNLKFEIGIPGLGTYGIQVGIDLFKRIGQEKDPNSDQKKTAHDVNHSHISFYFVKGREE